MSQIPGDQNYTLTPVRKRAQYIKKQVKNVNIICCQSNKMNQSNHVLELDWNLEVTQFKYRFKCQKLSVKQICSRPHRELCIIQPTNPPWTTGLALQQEDAPDTPGLLTALALDRLPLVPHLIFSICTFCPKITPQALNTDWLGCSGFPWELSLG